MSQPRLPTSRAERRITWKSCVFESVGRSVQTAAAALDTSGAEKLVPSTVAYPVASYMVGIAAGMSCPGAARSIAADALEKSVTKSLSSVAPTVRTCGKVAGYDGELPPSRSLPADATTS